MSAVSEPGVRVWHYDGVSGIRRAPRMVAADGSFVLEEESLRTGPFAFDSLIAQGAGQFGMKQRPGWRMTLAEEPPAAIAALLPKERRYGGVIDRVGLWPAMLGFALISAAVVAVIATTPAMVARLIPRSVEARMGALMVGDFGKRACNAPAGVAALDKLAERMQVPSDVDLRVIDVPMVNAVTLPGGHVVLFSGLLDEAKSPDEVAGVLGHELGHVAHRDVLESLVRQLGLSVVLGGLDGNVGGYTNTLLAASYSRDAEARADGYAIDALGSAHISPAATAGFFERLSKMEVRVKGASTLLGYLSSHPLSSARERRFEAAARGQGYTPALAAADWAALRRICEGAEEDSGFNF